MNFLKQVEEPEEIWYKEGLNFQCTGCGKCCTGAPGYVWLEEEEVEAIAAHLHLSLEEFSRRYLRVVDGRISLKELAPSNDCIFLKEKKRCAIYEMRPKQCRTFPFWPQILKSAEEWKEAAKRCEGIREDAPLISLKEIEATLY